MIVQPIEQSLDAKSLQPMIEPLQPKPQADSPVVQLEGVGKRYNEGTVALQDVNVVVREGEFVSLLGPSGCGKSTVLKTIAGLQSASSGSVKVLGDAPERLSGRPGELSFVFQDATLMPWRTVIGNVALPLELMRVGKAERLARAAEVLELVGLRDVGGKLPRQLSGGMRMRVSIARALISQPKLLLLDEPFGALDEITRQKLNEELLRLWKTLGMTVVFVTHNVFEAVYLSSRIVVMKTRPGTVKGEVQVGMPYPRSGEMRTSPDFANAVAKAMRFLEEV